MKAFETPTIEVITFTVENIMASGTGNESNLPTGENRLPWG